MGRHKKEKANIRLTTLNVSEEVLDIVNREKRIGETQNECLKRILFQYHDIREITDNYVFIQEQYENQTRLTAKYVQENKELRDRLETLQQLSIHIKQP